ncbi:ABC-2 type transport system permease protein [Deinococcus metalli]|uniref:Transport permease protein n=1 Tax=Deinococcus metalli TaxID=1141878 RepID=A0A7W8KDR3_9DEIO|nr:ABC transporter permease [Deinococcus metalli]MBB5376317.1 ABC-2 type transport system permease protein [Deinococcus metalli]GHF39202.1 ABC transporter [Deinococcus metalli]
MTIPAVRTTDLPAPAPSARRAPRLPALGALAAAELRRMLRNPMFAVGTIGFPVMFFALFGLSAVNETTDQGLKVGPLILVNFGAYSLLSLAMFSFGSAVALERTGGWLRLLRASPMPTALYFAGKLLAALCFSALSLGVLYTFAHVAGGVTMPVGTALLLLGKLLLGMVPLIALGLCIGFLVTPTGAQITANLVSVLMSFASGLFTPLDQMPAFVQKLAPYLPAYHLGAVARGTVAGQTSGEAAHWLALATFAVIFGALAAWGLRRDEAREQ